MFRSQEGDNMYERSQTTSMLRRLLSRNNRNNKVLLFDRKRLSIVRCRQRLMSLPKNWVIYSTKCSIITNDLTCRTSES